MLKADPARPGASTPASADPDMAIDVDVAVPVASPAAAQPAPAGNSGLHSMLFDDDAASAGGAPAAAAPAAQGWADFDPNLPWPKCVPAVTQASRMSAPPKQMLVVMKSASG